MSQDPRFTPQLIENPERSFFQMDVSNLWIRLHDYHSGKIKHIRWGAIESIENAWSYDVDWAVDDSESRFHATFLTMGSGRMHAVAELPEAIFQMLQDEINKIVGTQ